MKLTKNADSDKYKYRGCSIGFDSPPEFLFTNGSFGKNIIGFGADISSSLHDDNKEKYILILVEGPIQRLDYTTLAAEAKAEAKYSIKFSRSNRKFYLILHCNESNSFLFVNSIDIYKISIQGK